MCLFIGFDRAHFTGKEQHFGKDIFRNGNAHNASCICQHKSSFFHFLNIHSVITGACDLHPFQIGHPVQKLLIHIEGLHDHALHIRKINALGTGIALLIRQIQHLLFQGRI